MNAAVYDAASITEQLVGLVASQTLTNKTLTSPVFDTGVSGTAIKDEDNMASDSATHLATQQSIKAYVDAAASGANTGLSNLAAVAINTTLVSDTDITDDLGTGDVRWKDTWFATLSSGLTAGDTLKLRGYDIDGTAYVDILTITSNNTVTADLHSSVTLGGNAIAYNGGAFHDGFSDFVANEHIDHTSVTLTAGTGLTGGGDISANRTFAVDGVLEDLDTLGANVADSEFIVGTGAGALAWESGATVRTSLGLGSAALVATDLADLNEATIEAAIDTLVNLTSIQNRTFTLADAGANAIFGWDDTASAYENLSQAEVLAVIGDAGAAAKGVVELATTAETTTGTDATRAITPDGLAGSEFGERAVQIIAIDYTTDATVADGKAYFHIDSRLAGMNLVDVHAEVITAGTTGTMDIQIANVTQAADILSTKITIDTGETGSDTAATPAVIDAAQDDMTENDVIRIDVDAIHTTAAKGLIITMGFRLP